MERWTRNMIRYRWAVVAVWSVIFLVSVVAMSGLADLLTNRFTLPGTDTHRAETILEDHFGQKTTGSFTIVARGEPGAAPALVGPVRQAAARASAELPTSEVAAVQPISDSVVTASIVSNLEPADAKGYTDEMRTAIGEIPGAEVFVSGQAAIEHDLDPVFAEDLKIGELFIAIPIALLILVFVFGTLAFLLPFIFAAAAIPTTLGIIWIFANFMELTTYLQNLVMLIGFGIAIDYSLLVVYRYREELAKAGSKEDAIVRTMETAGRAVVFSGSAVGIGLALMLFMPLPFMRGFGIGGLVIPLVSVICALTLLPVLLYFTAAKLDRVRLIPKRIVERRADADSNMWIRLSRAIMKRPLVFAASTTAFLVLLALPVFTMQVGPGSNEGIPQDLEGDRGPEHRLGGARRRRARADGDRDRHRPGGGRGRPGGAGLARPAPGGPRGRSRGGRRVASTLRAPRTSTRRGGTCTSRSRARASTGCRRRSTSSTGFATTSSRRRPSPTAWTSSRAAARPSGKDFLDLTYGAFPWLVLAVLLLTYVLLLRAFRSLLIPLKAIILNLLSIGAAYGLLVVFFKWGAADWFGLISFDQIEGWIPVFVFAMVFGLSMDYEVFLVSRMREEWDETHDNVRAVALGLAKTGRIVTAAGLIMFAAFMGFVAGSIVGLQQFGFGLAMAILIDVTIVRALLVPSAMALFGRWNWWLPDGVAKVFRVKPSPLQPKATRTPAPSATGR